MLLFVCKVGFGTRDLQILYQWVVVYTHTHTQPHTNFEATLLELCHMQYHNILPTNLVHHPCLAHLKTQGKHLLRAHHNCGQSASACTFGAYVHRAVDFGHGLVVRRELIDLHPVADQFARDLDFEFGQLALRNGIGFGDDRNDIDLQGGKKYGKEKGTGYFLKNNNTCLSTNSCDTQHQRPCFHLLPFSTGGRGRRNRTGPFWLQPPDYESPADACLDHCCHFPLASFPGSHGCFS